VRIQGLLASLLIAGCAGLTGEAAAKFASPPTVPHERIELFNGRDLQGFYTWLVDSRRADPRGVFTVTNGLLRISGDGLGYLATSNHFANYRLQVEFKWGRNNTRWNDRIGRARDSGIFLHATGPDGNSHDGVGAFMAAIECNLFQGATGDFLLIRGSAAGGALLAPRVVAEVAEERDAEGWYYWQRGGRRQEVATWGRINWYGKSRDWKDELDFRGPRDLERAWGEWNLVECLVGPDFITIRVNGVVANEVKEPSFRQGQILLQCEGSEVYFRRIQLHPLASEPANRRPPSPTSTSPEIQTSDSLRSLPP
jgi:hypothetical protein